MNSVHACFKYEKVTLFQIEVTARSFYNEIKPAGNNFKESNVYGTHRKLLCYKSFSNVYRFIR